MGLDSVAVCIGLWIELWVGLLVRMWIGLWFRLLTGLWIGLWVGLLDGVDTVKHTRVNFMSLLGLTTRKADGG